MEANEAQELKEQAEHGSDGDHHGENAHGEGNGPERALVLGVFRVLLQFLGFGGFHGG